MNNKMQILALLLIILSIVITPAVSQNDNSTCTTDSLALVTSNAVMGAYTDMKNAIETDVKADFMQFCSVFERTCTLNVADYSAALESACVSEGGQIVNEQATLDCEGKISGVPIPGGIGVEIQNIPGCIAASCDPNNLPADIKDAFAAIVDQVATEVETAVSGTANVTCGADTSGTGGGINASPLLAVFSVATLLFWTLVV